jgi:hypothetical protein
MVTNHSLDWFANWKLEGNQVDTSFLIHDRIGVPTSIALCLSVNRDVPNISKGLLAW